MGLHLAVRQPTYRRRPRMPWWTRGLSFGPRHDETGITGRQHNCAQSRYLRPSGWKRGT